MVAGAAASSTYGVATKAIIHDVDIGACFGGAATSLVLAGEAFDVFLLACRLLL